MLCFDQLCRNLAELHILLSGLIGRKQWGLSLLLIEFKSFAFTGPELATVWPLSNRFFASIFSTGDSPGTSCRIPGPEPCSLSEPPLKVKFALCLIGGLLKT